MGKEESSENQGMRGGTDAGRWVEEGLISAQSAKSRADGLSLECAVCVYFELLRSLQPQDRLMFFEITSLLRHVILFQEL